MQRGVQEGGSIGITDFLGLGDFQSPKNGFQSE